MDSSQRKKHTAKLLRVHHSRLRRFSRRDLSVHDALRGGRAGWYVQAANGWEFACSSHPKLRLKLAADFSDLPLEDLVEL